MYLANNVTISTKEDSYVFVVENVNTPIKAIDAISNASKDYEFVATVAMFGIINENGREYQKEDYLSHLPGLKDKISKNSLMGELDHPQNYDTSIKNVSHVITDIWYDKTDNTVKIKLRIVDTPYGRIAKILIDAGVQLSVSSRSAGKVDNNGRVTLYKIFTFDLVAEPGFAQAILEPAMSTPLQENFSVLNESLNYKKDVSITNKLELLYESRFFGDNAKIYKVNESDILSFEKILEKYNNKNNTNEMVSKTEFDAYSKTMQSEMATIKKLLEQYQTGFSKLLENKDDDKAQDAQAQTQAQDAQAQTQAQDVQVQAQAQKAQDIQAQAQGAQPQGLQPQAQDIQAQAQAQGQGTQPQSLDIQVQPQGAQPQSQSLSIDGQPQGSVELPKVQDDDTNSEIFNKLIQYVNFIAKQLEVVMGHSDVLTEMLNKSINYTETVGTTLNEHINYTNATNKLLNETINYTNELAGIINHNGELFEKSVGYLNLIGTRLNETIELSNVISDKTNNLIKFNEYSSSIVNEHIDFTNVLANQMNVGGFVKGTANVTNRNLENNVANINESYNNIIGEVDKVLSAINERSNTNVLEQKYPFLKLLSESNKNAFYSLDNDTKVEVISTLEKGVYFDESGVMSIITGVLENKNSNIPTYVRFMPDKYKQVYESMSQDEKANIHRKATSRFYKLNTPYQIKSFWDSQSLNGRKQLLEEQKIIEKQQGSAINENNSQSTEGLITINQYADLKRGYSLDYINGLTRHASNH